MAGSISPSPMPGRKGSEWPLLFRAIGAASDPRCLILAALGLVAFDAGWAGLSQLFGEPVARQAVLPAGFEGTTWASGLIGRLVAPVAAIIVPFVDLFHPESTGLDRLRSAAGGLWALVAWGLFGGAIARVAAVRVATGGRVGVISALGFSLARLGTTLAAPMAPLAVAWLIGMAGAAVGLLNRIPGPLGVSAATLLAIIPLVVGMLDAVILLGLAAAWPLMVATVVVEGEDFFDALSRSYSYVNQRFFTYAACLALILVLGVVGLLLVGLFVTVILGLADWSLAIGSPSGVGFRFLGPDTSTASGLPAVGRLWSGVVDLIARGWASSFFWSGLSIAYLVLRYDVDGSEIRDIYEPGQDSDAFIPEAKSSAEVAKGDES